MRMRVVGALGRLAVAIVVVCVCCAAGAIRDLVVLVAETVLAKVTELVLARPERGRHLVGCAECGHRVTVQLQVVSSCGPLPRQADGETDRA